MEAYKNILVFINPTTKNLIVDYAAAIAEKFGACLIGIIPFHIVSQFKADSLMCKVKRYKFTPIDNIRGNENAITMMERRFTKLLHKFDIIAELHFAYNNNTLNHRTSSDLLIIEYPFCKRFSCKYTPEQFILETSGPVLIIPPGGKLTSFKKIIIAWNGSLQVRRAILHAMPFIRQAESIVILTVDAERHYNQIPGAEIKYTLMRHGFNVEIKHVPSGKNTVAQTLIQETQYLENYLLITGVCGNTSNKRAIMEGVTCELLEKNIMPLLVSF
ncbi:hypothetical protein [Citrobacter koseri]|uniref:hypothetical protein n=1 Tax=Citrobacter koseri TaxID=545 RepID=UPI0023AFC411|nr:hypothetical protein [Citrobacter koseri]